jgi:dipeptidyl aminopeptidase/acylaminoacyl peptidase
MARVAAPQPLTALDLVRTYLVRDPQISPDGRWIVFSAAAGDVTANTNPTNLYLVPLAGGETRRLTATAKGDFLPRWAPDGKRVTFVSSRGGEAELWTIPVAGGEATKLGGAALGVEGPAVWSPKGDRLLFAGKAYPQCKVDLCNAAESKRREQSKVKAEVFDALLYRHWNAWRHGQVNHVFSLTLSDGSVRDLTPGPHDAPPIALGGDVDYALSPDGRMAATVMNTDRRVATSTNNDVFLQRAPGGAWERITTSQANDHSPRFTPDGKALIYLAMVVPKYEADRQRLVRYDLATRKHQTLTEAFDRSVDAFVIAPDGRTIYFTAHDRGYVPVFAVPATGGAVRTVVDKVFATGLQVSPDGQTLVFAAHATDNPPEVYKAAVAGGAPVRLTGLNDGLRARTRRSPVEHLWYTGAGGDQVHTLVVRPPNAVPGRKYPVVVILHGGPQGMNGDEWHPRWNVQLFAAPGYVVLQPNFHGSVGYGQKFTDAIQGDWGGKPYEDVLKAIDAAVAKLPYVDKTRICAAGASYGGYLVNWVGTQTTRFRCLISHAGVFDLRSKFGTTEELWFPEREFKGTPWSNPEMYRKWSPSTHVAQWKTPTLVVHGEHDYRVTIGQGMQLFTSLQRLGVPSRFLYFPDEFHFVTRPQNRLLWWRTVHEWLARYLGPGAR